MREGTTLVVPCQKQIISPLVAEALRCSSLSLLSSNPYPFSTDFRRRDGLLRTTEQRMMTMRNTFCAAQARVSVPQEERQTQAKSLRYRENMAREDCPLCKGTGWRLVARKDGPPGQVAVACECGMEQRAGKVMER